MATPIPKNHARFTAAEVAMITGGALVAGPPGVSTTGISTDSREIESSSLFLALKGETFDGHAFVETAVAAGAKTLVVSEEPAIPIGDVAVVLVDDTLQALGKLARAHRDRWARRLGGRCAVVAITGSAGKTTTKELTAAAIASRLGDDAVLMTRGNLNNRIGVPMTLLGLTREHRAAVIEAGTSVRGEIAALAEIIEPDVSLLVGVGVAHAEGLMEGRRGAHESVAREKGALLAAAKWCAIACADDPWATAALSLAKAKRTLRFGHAPGADVRIAEATFSKDGKSRVRLDRPAPFSIALPLLGEAAAVDLAGAIAAAEVAIDLVGADPLDHVLLDASLAKRVRAVPGRLAPRRRKDGAVILDDSYNANPASYRASIAAAKALAESTERRLIVVAGEVRELGAYVTTGHIEIAEAIVEAAPAQVFSIGPDATPIAEAAKKAGIGAQSFVDATAAAEIVARAVAANDVVLVKGSRGVRTEIVVDAILARGGEILDGEGGEG